MSELHKNLKSLRRERKIELQAIEKRTKIDLKYLKAIESGNFEVLPSTYIRLFLKAYCVEIGADPLDALHQLDDCLLYTSPSPRDRGGSRKPSSA